MGLGLSEAAWHFCRQLLWGPVTKKAKVGSPKKTYPRRGPLGCDLGVKMSGQGTLWWKQAQANRKESPWLGREEWVGGWLQGRGREGLGGVLEQRQRAGPIREGVLRAGVWLRYHPFSWGAFPSLHHLPGWPWGFIMGVSEPPTLP